MLNNNLTKISNIMSFSSDVPDPDPDLDSFFKIGSGQNRTQIFFSN